MNKISETNNEGFENYINVSKTIKKVGKWLTAWRFTSVDVTGIYHNQFNKERYIKNCIHFIILSIIFSVTTLIISNDSLWHLIDNQYLPRHTRVLTIAALAFAIVTLSLRFDVLISERNNHLKFFKFAYYLQENDKWRHGLTNHNLFKISIFTKTIEIFIVKLYPIFLDAFVLLAYSYIAIKSNNFILQIVYPAVIYAILMVTSTISLAILIAFVSVYYYKLLFDQINDKLKQSINDH